MENATKALTMAASMLIALVIIGAVLLVFNNLNSYQKVNDQLKKDAKVLEFNNQFETYNRTDIRGSDLISLMNRVIDYNERQSSTGTEGQDLGYKPIILTINLTDNDKENIKVPNSDAGGMRLITKSEYIININAMDTDFAGILSTVKEIERSYGQDNLTKLCVSIDSIFLTGSPTDQEKKDAIKKYYDITKEKKEWNDLKQGSKIRGDVYKYYEYIQFKRIYFDCMNGASSGVEYDDNGRITAMYFVGNGKIE